MGPLGSASRGPDAHGLRGPGRVPRGPTSLSDLPVNSTFRGLLYEGRKRAISFRATTEHTYIAHPIKTVIDF